MKNLARNIAIAIAMSAVFFIGCSNDVGGSMGNNTLLAVLLSQNSKSNITKLTLNATSDDGLVNFKKSDDATRTVLPAALDASKMTFYYWGTDTINASNNTSINTPATVAFNDSGDGVTGTVAVNLSVSAYKLKLAGCLNTDLPAAATPTVADVMAKAVVFGVAEVDLRYTQQIKFYLNPNNISGKGSVDIRFRTKDAWHKEEYSVTVRIEDKATGKELFFSDNTAVGASTEQEWYAIGDDWTAAASHITTGAANTGLATTDGVEYKISNINNGSYNLVVDYYNGTKHYYWSDTLIILSGQIANMTNVGTEITDGVWCIELPNNIEDAPEAPANLRVGYSDPDNREGQKFLATFEWDDKSTNEEYFLFELLDVTDCNSGTITPAANVTGFDDDTKAALASIAANYPNGTATKDLLDETGAEANKGSWPVLAAHADVKQYVYRETIYQDFESLYAAGSLGKNSTSLSLWLDLGHSYVARITSINEASGSQDGDCDKTKTAGQKSKSAWIYTNEAALTTADPRPVVTDTTTAGLAGTSYSPRKWESAPAPLAINRYRLEYILAGGSFYAVDSFGVPTTWNPGTKVSDIEVIPNYLTYYDNITSAGKAIVDPTIWANNDTTRDKDLDTTYSGSATDYVTLYKGKCSFKGWYKDNTSDSGNLYSKIDWNPEAGTTNDGSSTDTYVARDYGIINGQAVAGSGNTAAITDSITGKVYTNKLMSVPLYFEGGNLTLVASYGSDIGDVVIDDPYNYKLYSQNIRVYKMKGNAGDVPYSTSNATASGTYVSNGANETTAVCDFPGANYDDGEVSSGTFKISSYFEKLSIVVVENQLAASNKDTYNKVEVEICNDSDNSSFEIKQGIKTSYIVSSSTKGSNTEKISKTDVGTLGSVGSDPLLKYTDALDNTHNAYYFVIPVRNFTPGMKYVAKIRAYTNEYKASGYNYNLHFEVTEPEYDMTDDGNFTEVTNYNDTTEGTYYLKSGSEYKKSPYNCPKAAKDPAGFDGSAADKKLYKLTGTPAY